MSKPISGNTQPTTPHDHLAPNAPNAPNTPNVPSSSNPVTSAAMPTPPTNRAPTFLTDAEVLRFVADHMDTGLPTEHAHLLERANNIIMRRRNANAARFEYIGTNPSVRNIVARLQNAAAQGQLPDPYPMSTDPLNLESWAASATPDQVVFVARQFPHLHNGLMTYWNKVSAD